jgi:large subunit ribosomal protein L18
MAKTEPRIARTKRHTRVRLKVTGTPERPRLCVFRSLTHIYAQVIDDARGHTLAAASTVDPEIRSQTNGKAKGAQAELVGTLIAQRTLGQEIKKVTFDRGGYKYHGRVKSLAEAARKSGLEF